jgi:hypothetical protein
LVREPSESAEGEPMHGDQPKTCRGTTPASMLAKREGSQKHYTISINTYYNARICIVLGIVLKMA